MSRACFERGILRVGAMISRSCLLALILGPLSVACDNPSVDPDAAVSVSGEAVDDLGRPLAGAEARLVKFWSDTQRRQPTAEQLFAESPSRTVEGGLRAELVAVARTSAGGFFGFELTGEDIAQPGGAVDARGRVEVADVVVVIRDPDDLSGRTGAYTYAHTFRQTDLDWDAGRLSLWDADGRVDDLGAELELSWRAVDAREAEEDEPYRVIVEAPSGGRRLVLNCSTRDGGGCERTGEVVRRRVSAATIDRYYAAPDGSFSAWVQADGRDQRFVAALGGAQLSGPPTRDELVLEEVWAAGDAGEEDLLGTAAVDGDPTTRARVSGRVTEIYVKLGLARITDAGILGALLSGAANGCVEVEFTGTSYADVLDARTSLDDDWQPRGRFCGENGGPGEVSALVAFPAPVTFAWMRLRTLAFGAVSTVPVFREIGEVAVFAER